MTQMHFHRNTGAESQAAREVTACLEVCQSTGFASWPIVMRTIVPIPPYRFSDVISALGSATFARARSPFYALAHK